jgi:pimeloyl-ACP methyl ester carboxylesterase
VTESAVDAELLAAFLSGVLNSVEDIQRAVAPAVHATFGAPVYERVRAGATVAARVVGRSPRLSAASTKVLTGATVRRLTGVVDGAIGTPRDTRPTDMSVRVEHRRVRPDRESLSAVFPAPSGRLVVLLHGLIETERWWFHRPARNRTGTDFGSRLAEDLPCSQVYVRYHSGRPVAANGAELVDLIEALIAAWPVPVTEIALVGHSMGGLVARNAIQTAHRQGRSWLSRLTRVVCLGTPFAGAPVERAVARVAAACGRVGLRPLARLVALRSDGIKDLADIAHDEEWPDGVREYRLDATMARSAESRWARLGDLVVAPSDAVAVGSTVERGWLGGLHHLDLLHHDSVYDAVLAWLRRGRADA